MPQPLIDRKSVGQDLALGKHAGALEFMPRNFAELEQFAARMADSRFVPASLRGKPGDCFMVALQALRWEMDPIAVANEAYFAKEGGPPGYSAKLITAVVYARAPLLGRLSIEWKGEGEDLECTVKGKLRGDDEVKVRTVKIRTITTRNSPLWKTDPRQQIAYYTLRAWARLHVPEILLGVRAADEIEDMTEEERAAWATDVTPKGNGAERPESKLDALEKAIEGEQRSFYRGAELAPPLGPLPEPPEPPAAPIQEPPEPEAPEEPEEPEAPEEPPEEQGDAIDELLEEGNIWSLWGSPNEYARQLAETLNVKRKEGSAAFEETLKVNKRYIDNLPPEVKTKLDDFIIANRERLRQRPQP